MQSLGVSGAVRLIYKSLGVKGLKEYYLNHIKHEGIEGINLN